MGCCLSGKHIAFLSKKSSDTPGLLHPLNILFLGRFSFPRSFSERNYVNNDYVVS